MVFSHTALTASGQPFQPVADQHAHVPDAAVLDLRADPQPVLGSLAVAVLAGPQAQDVALAVHGDAQREVDRPVRDLALADLHVNGVDEDHRVNRVQWPALPFRQALHHPVSNGRDRLLGYLGAVYLGQVRGDLPVGQPFRGQGNHHLIDSGQPPLPLGDDFRLEAGIPVPRHGNLHRPGIGNHRLGPAAVTGIAAVAAFRVMLAVAEVIVQLAFQGAFDDHLGQPPQQTALAGQLQPAGAGPLGQLTQQLLIGRRELRPGLVPVLCHVSHLVFPPSRELHRLNYSPETGQWPAWTAPAARLVRTVSFGPTMTGRIPAPLGAGSWSW